MKADLASAAAEQCDISRRSFVTGLGAGLIIAASGRPAINQEAPRRGGENRRGGRDRPPAPLAARLHIGQDGVITLLSGKVECGQGARAQLTQAAAEELSLHPGELRVILADTDLVPDDGITAGSRTSPSTVPAVRQACAAARQLLIAQAAKAWGVETNSITLRNGAASEQGAGRTFSYGDLAKLPDAAALFAQPPAGNVAVTAVERWQVMGTDVSRPNGPDIVTGRHVYPSDISLPDMLRARVLRPPAIGATLVSIDLAPARDMPGVKVMQEGDFVAVAAPTLFAATKALGAIEKTARWDRSPQPSSGGLYEHLRQLARGGVPANPFADALEQAEKTLKQTYCVAYAQHAPMEPRAAVAQWRGDKLTVWTGTQNPFGSRGEIARAVGVSPDNVRVIVPDFGGGFGGKHSPDAGVEAARIAKALGQPIWLRWTRPEEFTFAYFRPAAVIDVQASLSKSGDLASWFMVNINSGGSALESPYRAPQNKSQFVGSDPPLRHGSYRGLAATANNFARESAIDELAHAAGRDPLEFRLAHLPDARLAAVLSAAAKKFDWPAESKKNAPTRGVGLACGTEKGSVVATCAQIRIDDQKKIVVERLCAAYECGAIINPANLMSQVQGALIMALGPALREAVEFENGRVTTTTFARYRVPRFEDVPQIDVELINRPDLPSAGAGETPIMAVAPAIANAVFAAAGQRVRRMPIEVPV